MFAGSFSSSFFQYLLDRRWLPWVVNGVVALLVTFSLVQKVAEISESGARGLQAVSHPPFGNDVEHDIQTLVAASLFGEIPAAAAEATDSVALTSLNLALKGVIAIKNSGLAFISVQGKPEDLFSLGQEVMPGVTLSIVHSDRVILRRAGRFETLMLESYDFVAKLQPLSPESESTVKSDPTTGRGTADKPFVVSRASLRSEVRSPQELLSQAVFVPNNGGGFLLKEVRAGSLIEQFGLRPGDVVRSANGQALNYADDIQRVYRQLADARQLKLELNRDGKREELNYQIR